MPLLLALFIGLLQGATELFPVSSLGHAVLVPDLLRLDYHPSDPSFLPFLVLLHLGTAGALLVLYRDTWARLIAGFVRASLRGRIRDQDERLSMLLVVGTVPTGIVGFFLQAPLRSLFASPRWAAGFLMVNAVVLAGGELLRRRDERRARLEHASRAEQEAGFRRAEQLGWGAALAVGACQSLALLPGISRSGSTMAAGLAAGLRHQEAARLSFLLATPIILAAGVLEVPELLHGGVPLGRYALAALLAGAVAYASARFLIRYFRVGRLDPFAAYCAILGAAGLVLAR